MARSTGRRNAAVAGTVAAVVITVGLALSACGQASKASASPGAGVVAATGTSGMSGGAVTPGGAASSSGFDYVAVTSTAPGSSSTSAPGSPASPPPPPPGAQQGGQPSSAPGGAATSRPGPPPGTTATTATTAKPPASTAPPPASSAKPPTTTAPPPAPPSSATPKNISGTVSCVSGNSVEGVWVQASKGSGYAPWQGIGNGSTSKYWYTLPDSIPFALHIGCGGTTSSWAVAANSPDVNGPVVNFTCYDVSGQAGYGTCEPQ